MKRSHSLVLGVALLAPFGIVGCAEESSVTTEKEVKTPEGSATVTTETTVEKTGDMKTEN